MAREVKLELKVGKTLRISQKSKVGSRKAGGIGQSESKPVPKRGNGSKKISNVGSNSRKAGSGGRENATRIRKRVYAEEDLDGESCADSAVLNSKASAAKGRNLVKSNSLNLSSEKMNRKSMRSMWVSDGISSAEKGETPSSHASPHAKELNKRDVFATDSLKENAKIKPTTNKPMGKNQESTHLRPSKKTVKEKKILDGDSEVLDEQPKKKKRVIKIDPYDFSNKRLDDGSAPAVTEASEEKKKESKKSDELSTNAQFRAIQPSTSILSFVEENLLGRRRMIELRRAGYNTELSAPLDNIPSSTGSERERIEENVFRNKLEFFAAAKVSSSFPPPEGPEIAFAGRSNVGKSSLLNALTRQWGVVRTSDKPGHTQTINFFKLGSKLRLVDLPGYGFAYAKDEVKEAWEELVKEYVSTRVGLKRVCLLVDTKWGLKPRDREIIDLMERFQTKYQVVLTKTDIVFPIDVARRAMQIEESLKSNTSIVQPVMMVSSKSGAGIRSLRTVLAKIARFSKL